MARKKRVPQNPAPQPQLAAEERVVTIHPGVRVGGAFLALAVVLGLFTFISLVNQGISGVFPVTWRFLMIIVASMLLGAFGTVHRDEERTTRHVVILVISVGLVVFSRFIAPDPIYVIASWWLPVYAVMALLCALVIRRTAY